MHLITSLGRNFCFQRSILLTLFLSPLHLRNYPNLKCFNLNSTRTLVSPIEYCDLYHSYLFPILGGILKWQHHKPVTLQVIYMYHEEKANKSMQYFLRSAYLPKFCVFFTKKRTKKTHYIYSSAWFLGLLVK